MRTSRRLRDAIQGVLGDGGSLEHGDAYGFVGVTLEHMRELRDAAEEAGVWDNLTWPEKNTDAQR